MAKLLLPLLAFIALTLGGCIDDAPAYDSKILTYDEALLGKWDLVPEKVPEDGSAPKQLPVEITARTASVTDGHLGKYNRAGATGPKESTVPAYHITITAPADGGDKESKEQVLSYDAVLIKVDGATFLAYQPAADRKVEGMYLDYLPVHRLALLAHDGDALTLRFMKSQVVWVPTLKPLDTPSNEVRLPGEEGQYLVTDPERLVKILALALKTPEAWDEPMRITRAK